MLCDTFKADPRTAGSYSPYCGVTIGRDPNPCKVICIDLVFDELAATLFVHVDAASLAVVDLAPDHSGVGVRLDLKASYPVPMDVAALKIPLRNDRKETVINQWFTLWFSCYIIDINDNFIALSCSITYPYCKRYSGMQLHHSGDSRRKQDSLPCHGRK